MGDPKRGLYHKFNIERTDGTSRQGCKHYDCDYFVLDLTHDKFAPAAILAYALTCEDEHPQLAKDLRNWLAWDFKQTLAKFQKLIMKDGPK